ncbi:MAG: hypothetical protein IAE99_08040 [Rhodothermales bacterium]|nr:hypothetical protein [Rhodothermales bacterium]
MTTDPPRSERIRRAYDAAARLIGQRRKDDPDPVVCLQAADLMALADLVETAGVSLTALDPFTPTRT